MVPSILNLTDLLRIEYKNLFAKATVKKGSETKVEAAYKIMMANQSRYEKVADYFKMPGVPWYLIAVLHMRESYFNFSRHLAEGSPLTGKTLLIPKGLPSYPIPAGQKAYTFEQGAIAAIDLKLKNTPAWRDYKNDASVESLLHKIETYNGTGYRRFAIPSPYLWSDSSVQKPGKYVADGVFSATTVDKQLGAATLLKYYFTKNEKKKPNKFIKALSDYGTGIKSNFSFFLFGK